jgi:hypothetical protein
MTWTSEKPSKPGLYWYRDHRDTQVEEYKSLKVFWDSQVNSLSAKTYEYGTVLMNSYSGEWYGPITPPMNISESRDAHIDRSNARILIRLRHGGSFYVEKILPEKIAVSLSERLKTIREQGSSIPPGIRMKITNVIRELIDFAEAPPKDAKYTCNGPH